MRILGFYTVYFLLPWLHIFGQQLLIFLTFTYTFPTRWSPMLSHTFISSISPYWKHHTISHYIFPAKSQHCMSTVSVYIHVFCKYCDTSYRSFNFIMFNDCKLGFALTILQKVKNGEKLSVLYMLSFTSNWKIGLLLLSFETFNKK